MNMQRSWAFILPLASLFLFTSCGGGSSGSSVAGVETGSLSLSLSDATTDDYNAVYVTVKEVQVHKPENKWQTLYTPMNTVNLLELVNGVRENLGLAMLERGSYTQLRMIIGETPDLGINMLSEPHPFANYIIDKSDAYHELKVPGGFKTGVKVVHGFDIENTKTTELVLDFDASKSVVKAGKSGKWLLKPTIKVFDLKDCSSVGGSVNNGGGYPMEGALMSVQIYDPSAADPKDRVTVQTSTLTDFDGHYVIFVHSGSYNLLAYKDGYGPVCKGLTAKPNTIYTEHFTLASASTGTVSGDVLIIDGGDEKHATLSFRKTVPCSGGPDQEVEVKSIHVVNQGDYSVVLPEGVYGVVASTYGRTTQEHDILVEKDKNTILDITFP